MNSVVSPMCLAREDTSADIALGGPASSVVQAASSRSTYQRYKRSQYLVTTPMNAAKSEIARLLSTTRNRSGARCYVEVKRRVKGAMERSEKLLDLEYRSQWSQSVIER